MLVVILETKLYSLAIALFLFSILSIEYLSIILNFLGLMANLALLASFLYKAVIKERLNLAV